jgi:hypothetical protein
MPSLELAPPVTVSEAKKAGEDFGFAGVARSRTAFELKLTKHLLALEELLVGDEIAADAIASFDNGRGMPGKLETSLPLDDPARRDHAGCHHQGAARAR